MQHDNSDDPWGFWQDEPTRQLKRTPAGTRSHGDTGMVPVVRMDRTRPLPEPHVRNPLLTRVSVMVGAILLLVPVALSLRDDKPQVRAADIQAVEPIVVGKLPPAPTTVTLPPAPTTFLITTAAPVTPVPTAAVVATPAPTEPPTTAAPVKKKVAPKTTTPATASPVAATQSADKVCNSTYTVVKGDAWSTIASRAKVSMKDLLAANNATTQSLLLPGMDICLPAGAVAPAPPTTKPATTQPPTTQPKPAPTQPTTPPATSAPATTQPPAPPNVYTKAQAAQIIRDVWPDDLEDEAIRIATRESNLIPTVHNSCCYGLFQIYYSAHRTWLAEPGRHQRRPALRSACQRHRGTGPVQQQRLGPVGDRNHGFGLAAQPLHCPPT